MNYKFKLSHVILYAKGWYLRTDNIFEDLKKILALDNYSPFSDLDVYLILLNEVQESKGYRWTELREVLNGIYPQNCWRYGYYVKDTYSWSDKPKEGLPDYDMPTAFIHYVLSCLRYINSEDWNPRIPNYKHYPKGKNITLKKVIDTFNKKI